MDAAVQCFSFVALKLLQVLQCALTTFGFVERMSLTYYFEWICKPFNVVSVSDKGRGREKNQSKHIVKHTHFVTTVFFGLIKGLICFFH
jgi:hypothetical protein